MVGNVIAVQALRARLKIGRCVNIAHPERSQIRHNLDRLRKCERLIELQSIGAGWNTRMIFFHRRKQTSDAQRPTSNAQSKNLRTRLVFEVADLPRRSLAKAPSAFS